jgi:cyclase
MDKDGTKSGYDIDLLKTVTSKIRIPVIASGGVGSLKHLYEGINKGGASAVLAASIFHYGEFTIQEAKEYLASKDVAVRIK